MDKINHDKIVSMYELRRPLKWISRATGMSTYKIEKYLKENNLWTGHRYLLSYYDEFFFDHIDTEEKAYWLGFIYADGYLAKPNTIGIELKDSDGKHLEKFKKSLHAERDVKYYQKNSTFGPQKSARFVIGSKHMFNILLNYFKSVNKTFEGVFPKLNNQELTRHLIRGFFDGDGSLYWHTKNYKKLIPPVISFIGTKETLQYIEQISGFSWNWSQRYPERKNNNYQIKNYTVDNCLQFLHYMYDNSTIFLDRKYQKYLTLIENRELSES